MLYRVGCIKANSCAWATDYKVKLISQLYELQATN